MGHLSSMFNGLARSLSIRKGRLDGDCGEAADPMEKKTELVLRSSGFVNVKGSDNFASLFSKRGEKGEFGCQADIMFCGIFDGNGPWGHFVAKKVREPLPSKLLSNWQEKLARSSINPDTGLELGNKLQRFNLWRHSFIKACAAIDQELEQYRKIDSFYSGTTALAVIRQGDHMVIANMGDSHAVLGTISDDGSLTAVQLTTDLKPNLPQEAEQIVQCNGRVFCLRDEPDVHRVWLPDKESPGLAMSRAFGDYCVKDFGLISVPEVTHRHINNTDQFVVLATDGVWDAISNEEAVQIVSSMPEREKAAKRLVQFATQAWKRKMREIAMDDISAICLFFHSTLLPKQLV